ncbi:MAG: hypothetical protein QOG97_3007 [Acidimicrobiaceae bacterium]|nr:hypothetical protein [Acidimicrobiaceae bacterium]
MLVLRPISGDQARYYLDGPVPGRWAGAGTAELGLRGAVDPTSLHAVLAGHHPDGQQLLARLPAARRSGFDLILAAPKSVSLLAALGDDDTRGRFLQAHEEAVGSTLGYLEREAAWTRRSGVQLPTTGLVGAAFPHALSGALDPHLHTHLVLANLVHGEDGRWSTLDSRALFRHTLAAGAVFQAGLRFHLAEQGLRFDWTITRHGLGDVVGVSRAAIEAASQRHRQVHEEIESGLAGRVGRATAAGRTRGAQRAGSSGGSGGTSGGSGDSAGTGGTSGSDDSWRERVAAAGLDRTGAERVLATAARRPAERPSLGYGPGPRDPDNASLTRLLSEQHSRFRRPDVVRAAATLSVDGAPAATLERVARDFLDTALPAGGDTWTTPGLRRFEERIVAAATAPRRAAGLVASATPLPRDLNDAGLQAVERLTRGGAPVDVLAGPVISQSRVLEAAREAWETSGHRVALVSQTERAQARWRTLAGLERPPSPPAHPTVVLVDNAERWSTNDLHQVMADAAARQAKVVLLDGGSTPRRAHAESPAMETLRSTVAAIDAGPAPPHLPDLTRAESQPVVRAGRDGTVTLAPTGQAAMDRLIIDWRQARIAGKHPRMVALGPEEAEHLNEMARAVRGQAGELRGPSVKLGGRAFQGGDEVVALRRDARLGSVRGGTLGRVTAVDEERSSVTVEWQGRENPLTVENEVAGKRSPPLAHSYATTPSYLRNGHDGPILSLGHVEAVAPRLHPDRIYDVVTASSLDRATDRGADPNQPRHMTALLADLPRNRRSGRDVTADAGRPLVELEAERDRLADQLKASAPPDTRPDLRRLSEERDWLVSIPDRLRRPEHRAALADLDQRGAALTAAAHDRGEWLEDHRGEIERWDDLSHAAAWREAALGRGAELRPTVAVQSTLGLPPPPSDTARQPAWRRAAAALEAHRERWQLPDRPLELHPERGARPDLTRRGGELRVLAAAKDLQRIRGADRSLDPPGL